MPTQDYYKILNIAEDADSARVKQAYRELAVKYHPDRNVNDPDAMDKMKQINEAYAVLSDTKKRREYDTLRAQHGSAEAYSRFRSGYSEQDIFSGADIHQVFDELSRSFGFRNFNDVFRQFENSGKNSFEYRGPGISMKGFFFFGSLNLSSFPGKTGRLVRTLLKKFSGKELPLHGKDLYDTIQIDPALAEKGGPYAYFHKWQAKKLVVTVPPNTRNGQKIRLKGMGGQGRGGSPGDLYLVIESNPSLMNKIRRFLPF